MSCACCTGDHPQFKAEGTGPPVSDDVDIFDWEDRDSSTPFWQHAVAGSCAGIMEHVATFPIDTVKTRMQTSRNNTRGVMETFREVVRERGYIGLMRGSSVVGIGCIPAHIGLFGMYEFSKANLMDTAGEEHQPLRAAFVGVSATLVHDSILTPIDVVKQRLQIGKHTGPIDCVLHTFRQEGLVAFYRSLPATLVTNVPYMGFLVAANESLKRFFQLDAGLSMSNAPLYFMTAGMSGAVAAAATLPLDVVKTRLQTQGMLSSIDAPMENFPSMLEGPRYNGILSTMRTIAKEEGLGAFYRGLAPRVLLAMPSAAICWGTYECVRTFLKNSNNDGAASLPSAEVNAESLDWEEWDGSMPFWQHAIAGSCAGVMEHVAMYPVDTVKTRMQAEPVAMGQSPPTVSQTVRLVLKENGPAGLMRGCWAIGVGCIPAHIGLFCTYEAAKLRIMNLENAEHQPLQAAACGALATVAHDFIIVPTDVVKQRLQLGKYTGVWDCVVSIWKHEGMIAFYRSLPTTLISECPFHGILVATNESLKLLLDLEGKNQQASLGWHFFSTGISGIFATVVTQPLDVVKTRLQTQNISTCSDTGQVKVKYSGLVSTVSMIYQYEGARGFFRGMLPRVCFAAPSAAMCWGTYEVTKKLMRQYST